MDKKELESLIDTGEGQTLEFKETSNNVRKEIVAFANAKGGKVIVGVSDSGNKKGLSSKDHHRKQIRQKAQSCSPPVRIDIEEVGTSLVVHVPESDRPHSASGTFYRRKGKDSQKLGQREIRDLLQQKGELEWDEVINDRFRFPEDFNQEAFDEFVEDSDISGSVPQKSLLRNIRAAKFDENGEINLTHTGILFFAEDPKIFLPQAEIQCTNWDSEDKSSYSEREKIAEPLIEAINDALDFIEDNLGTRTVISGRERESELQIPETVFREVVVNAVMHRDYDSRNQNVKVDIFPSKIVIRNPGGLLPGMTKDDLGKRSVWRNPTVADLLDRAGWVERSGSGINRIYNILEEEGFPEPSIKTNGHFEISIERQKDPLPDLEEHDLSDRQSKGLKQIYKKGELTAKEYSEALGDISTRTAQRDLNEMIDKNLVERIREGSDVRYVPK